MDSEYFKVRITDDYGNMTFEEAIKRLIEQLGYKPKSFFYFTESPEDRFIKYHYLKGFK